MMIPDRKPNEYAATAYNSEQLPPLQPEDLPINKPPFFCKSLPFGHTDIFNVPKYFYETSNPATLRETEQKTDQELIDDANKSHVKIDMCWNHRCIRYDTFASLAHVLITLYLIAKICIPIGFILGIVTLVIIHIISDANIQDDIEFMAVMAGTPLGLFILFWLITSLPPRWWMKSSKGAQWELNRETGMVSIFNYNTPDGFKLQSGRIH